MVDVDFVWEGLCPCCKIHRGGGEILFCLICFFTSHQQSFSYKGTGLPGLNQY